MSNRYYDLTSPKTSPLNRKATRLLYVSAAKYGGDWSGSWAPHISQWCEKQYME